MRDDHILELARTDRRGFIDHARLQAAIEARGLDAVVASSSANVTYTGGSYIDFPPLISVVVTKADGRQGIVMNEADSIYFREYSWIDDIRSYRYAASTVEANLEAVRLLAEMLREYGVSDFVGVEETPPACPVPRRARGGDARHAPCGCHGGLR